MSIDFCNVSEISTSSSHNITASFSPCVIFEILLSLQYYIDTLLMSLFPRP